MLEDENVKHTIYNTITFFLRLKHYQLEKVGVQSQLTNSRLESTISQD